MTLRPFRKMRPILLIEAQIAQRGSESVQAPDAGREVALDGESEAFAVRMKVDAEDRSRRLKTEDELEPAFGEVVKVNGAIAAAAGQQATIGVQREGFDG